MERTCKRHRDKHTERNFKQRFLKRPWTKPCLHMRFTKQNRIEGCPISTPQEKKDLLEAHTKFLKNKRQRNDLKTIMGTSFRHSHISLDIGGIHTEARDDTEAYITVNSRCLTDRILSASPHVHLNQLCSPLKVNWLSRGKLFLKSKFRRHSKCTLLSECLEVACPF